MSDQTVMDYLAGSSPYSFVGLSIGQQNHDQTMLPKTSHASNDNGANPLHPDSPVFWVVAILGATLLGIFGVSIGGKAGPVKGSLEVGKV